MICFEFLNNDNTFETELEFIQVDFFKIMFVLQRTHIDTKPQFIIIR